MVTIELDDIKAACEDNYIKVILPHDEAALELCDLACQYSISNAHIRDGVLYIHDILPVFRDSVVTAMGTVSKLSIMLLDTPHQYKSLVISNINQ